MSTTIQKAMAAKHFINGRGYAEIVFAAMPKEITALAATGRKALESAAAYWLDSETDGEPDLEEARNANLRLLRAAWRIAK